MAYPSTIDAFTNKVDGTSDVLATDINSVQNSIVALETKVGITGSAVTSSLDYLFNYGTIGRNQTWQRFTTGTDRVNGVTYTNSTSRSILVHAVYQGSGSSMTVTITVSGVVIIQHSCNSNAVGVTLGGTFIVPTGATYSVNTMNFWAELR